MVVDSFSGPHSAVISPTNLSFPVREINYEIPRTNIGLDLIVFLENPIERQAMGAALLSGMRWIRERLREKGEGWLDKEDDPFVSSVPGRCVIQISSKKMGTGRSRMTYTTLLRTFEGMWAVLYAGGLDNETCLRIHVAGLLAGFGGLRVLPRPDGLTDA
ncbi:MAG: hypothetical protein Q9207_007220 [Kuettlingeria erythrocarpa]